jgi:hypothetical protein
MLLNKMIYLRVFADCYGLSHHPLAGIASRYRHTMTLSNLFGPELASKQPHLVPLFRFFDWASGNNPEGDPRDFFALQPGGKVPGTNLLDDPALMVNFAPSAQQLTTHFNTLCLTLAKPPRSIDLEAQLASPLQRYKLISSHTVGGFLSVAQFWIPPLVLAQMGTGVTQLLRSSAHLPQLWMPSQLPAHPRGQDVWTLSSS